MLGDSIVSSGRAVRAQRRVGLLDGAARSAVLRAFRALRTGVVEFQDDDGEWRFGTPHDPAALRARIRVECARFYRATAWGGALGAGEAYIDGHWTCDDLTALFRILLQNEAAFDGLHTPLASASRLMQRGWHAMRRNTRTGSRRNIAAHYDLSNDFYRLFLDETMTYSSGIFARPDTPLREASIAKLDRICRKLRIGPEDHVLEIGTGWGSFALHAAETYGCRVTTTTISNAQFELAQQRVHQAGLGDRVTVLRRDYRDLEGRFDKLVSIEMIEAVGWQYYDVYFRKIAELLKPDGAACIQAITMADRYYERARRTVDFIRRHIFPGSCIPSIGAMAASVARATDLTLAHVEDITTHYAKTLRLWHERFMQQISKVRDLGFADSFVRKWSYYLCYCEAGFLERTLGNVQIILVKPGCRAELPLGAI